MSLIRFLLNDQEVSLADFDPQTTVLDWLRQERGLCGTKEGCASGDCGACTVVIAEGTEEGLDYRSVNSCITFLGALHGRQLITVEHLADGESLHPVQQAMVDFHASQCGYCTPGIVMSLFALSHRERVTGSAHGLHEVHDWLGGNLCRCTGYRPIVEAAMASLDAGADDRFERRSATTLAMLRRLDGGVDRDAGSDRFLVPRNIHQLVDAIEENPGARLLAGGTDLALEVTQGLNTLERLILLDRVSEMRRVEVVEDTLSLGAAVTLTDCREVFARYYPPVDDLLGRFGSRQVRNQGTLGGNVANASPIGDLPPVLLALGAEIRLQGRQGSRRMPLDEFFLGYRSTALVAGEVLRDIQVPLPAPHQFFRVYKVSKRMDDDISAVCLAVNLLFDGPGADAEVVSARIGVGGMAAIPRRAGACEGELTGRPFDEASLGAASDALDREFEPIDDARASAGYRARVARNLLRRCLLERQSGDFPLRVTDVH